MRRLMIACAMVALFASGVAADRAVTYFSVVLTDVSEVTFTRSATAPNGWRARAQAQVRVSGGTTYQAAISGNVTAGQRTSIETYITNNVLGALNTQEGL